MLDVLQDNQAFKKKKKKEKFSVFYNQFHRLFKGSSEPNTIPLQTRSATDLTTYALSCTGFKMAK